MLKTSSLFKKIPPFLKELFSKEYPWEILPDIKGFIEEFSLSGYEEIEKGIFISEGVKIDKSARLTAPLLIGKNTEVRIGAFIRGSVIIGENCVIGNSTELKNCIILDNAQVPHYNYVGDSILGFHAHMGAGAVCSNLKADGKNVVIKGDREHKTNLRKVGGFLGDFADIGCGCVINPGTVIGRNTSAYPLTFLRGVYPEDSIIKNNGSIVKRK